MSKNKIIELKKPGEFSENPLTELLRNGARQLISDAVESELQELLNQYAEFKNEQGLSQSPKLAVGDGALGFWKAMNTIFPKTKHQRCWVHKTANVLNKLPKMVQPKVKQALHEIWMAPTRKDAYEAFDIALTTYSAKYPRAMECLEKDKVEMLAFYDFPAPHWQHTRTSNPIESTFATVLFEDEKNKRMCC